MVNIYDKVHMNHCGAVKWGRVIFPCDIVLFTHEIKSPWSRKIPFTRTNLPPSPQIKTIPHFILNGSSSVFSGLLLSDLSAVYSAVYTYMYNVHVYCRKLDNSDSAELFTFPLKYTVENGMVRPPSHFFSILWWTVVPLWRSSCVALKRSLQHVLSWQLLCYLSSFSLTKTNAL